VSIACSKRPNDDSIAKDIQDKIAADPATNDSQVQVVAKDGKVTLSGTAKNPAAQQRAEQIAHDEAGTTGVDNQTSMASSAMAQDQSAMPAAAAPPPEEKPKPQPIVVPAGTSLTVRLGQGLSSKDSQEGQTFLATIAQPVSVTARPRFPLVQPHRER
jgi:BON domain